MANLSQQNQSIVMEKGFIKITIMEIQSEYFNNRKINLTLTADDSTYQLNVAKCPTKFNDATTFFPMSEHIELKVYENQQTDTRYGYFKIPLSKLYDYPLKNHVLSIKCVWIEKSDNRVDTDISAIVRLSIVYQQNATANFTLQMKEANLQRDIQEVGKMDPFVQCKIGQTSLQTDVKNQAGKNPIWNQTLPFLLESIPHSIIISVKDKDMVKDEVIGSKKVNPHEEGWFIENKEIVQRQIQLQYGGKRAGTLKLSTFFSLAK